MTLLNPKRFALLPLALASAGALFVSATALGADHVNAAQAQARDLLDRPIVHSTRRDDPQARELGRLADPQNQARQLLLGHAATYSSGKVSADVGTVVQSHDTCRASCTYPDAQESARRLLIGQSDRSLRGDKAGAGTTVSQAKVR